MSRLLVCPPDYFEIDYEINPWMRLTNRVDHGRAVRQWHELMRVLEKDLGVVLERMTPLPGLPDLVFTANAGIVVGQTAVVSHFRYPERQPEEAHFEHWFRGKGYDVLTLTRIIHDGSSRNRAVAKRDGRVEPRETEAYLKQYVEATRGEPARRHAAQPHAGLSQRRIRLSACDAQAGDCRRSAHELCALEEELYFEGAGDLLGFPDYWFGGYRQRSDIRVFPVLSEHFHREIIPLELVDGRFYHLDTCFCPLSGGELLYFPAAFDGYGRTAIAERVPDRLRFAVPEDEALKFACNAVCVGKHVVLPAGCPVTQTWLCLQGYETHPVQLDEFMKSGGAAKCLTLALD